MSDQNQNDNKSGLDTQALLKEFSSKLESLEKNLDSKVTKLQSSLQQPKQTKQVVEDEDLTTLIYSDPKRAVEKITTKVKEEVQQERSQQDAASAAFQDRYLNLSQEYPEIANPNHQLHKRAKELLGELSKGPNDYAALELAVYRAANEVGLTAMKNRKQRDEEDMEGYTGAGSSTSTTRTRKDKEDGLDPRTIAIAELMGRPVKDPEYIKRLQKYAKERKGNWNKYK